MTRPEASDDDSTLPLEGLRVLELCHIVAGPSASLLLAELGADVIKVEHPATGDAGRNMPNYGSTFYFLNRNKRSLALDLKRPEGREVFRRLVSVSDVVIDNYRPGALDDLGVGYVWGRTVNPRVIYCSIKGFLPGPNGNRPFLDELAQMAGGLAYMTGPRGQPLRAGASIVDIGAATYGVLGILAALYRRESTGTGQYVQSGLFETTVFWVGQHITRSQLTGRVPDPLPSRGMGGQMGWGVYQLFSTRDGRQVFIAITSNAHWKRFCEACGLSDLLADPSLSSNRKRVAQKQRLNDRIADVVGALTFEEVTGLLHRAEVPYAPVNTPADLISDPHLQEGGHLLSVDVPEQEGLQVPTLPVMVGATPYSIRSGPPRLGEHSPAILAALGYSVEEIEVMAATGVVRTSNEMLRVDEPARGGD